MKADESSPTYLNRAQAYADAPAKFGEPIKENDLVMLVMFGLREEYNGLKSTILTRKTTLILNLPPLPLLTHNHSGARLCVRNIQP